MSLVTRYLTQILNHERKIHNNVAIVSIVAVDELVLKHQAIRIPNTDSITVTPQSQFGILISPH